MPEILVVERSATLCNLLERTLESAGVGIARHFERFGDAVEEMRERVVSARLPALLVIGIPEREPAECQALLKIVRELSGASLPLLILSHAPLPRLDAWLERRGSSMRLLWSQFWQVPGAISELAPNLLFSTPPETVTQQSPMRLLLVDDSVSVRRTYHQLLTQQGLAVDLAESIAEGFARARAGRYDLIVVDYYLPDGTGDQLVRKLRADPATEGAVIALITATYSEDVIQKVLDAGAVECLFKNEVISLTLARIKALARSVQDRRRIETERRQLDGILRSVGDGVYGLDEAGVVTFANPTACRLLGYAEAGELVGKDGGQLRLKFERDDVAGRMETYFNTADKRMLPVECSMVPMLVDGEVEGSVVVFRDISERKSVERVRWELDHDKLTGLSNRRHFLATLGEAVEGRREGGYSAVLFLDIDRYTQVLENAGELAGQQLLVDVGQRLKARLRGCDALARLEHDQFGLRLEDVQLEHLYTLADSLREMLREARYTDHAGRVLPITVSVGVAIVSKDSPSAEYVLENARQACAQAKRRGQNQTQIFVIESDSRIAKELEAGWAQRIREALSEDRIILLGHPILPVAGLAEKGGAWQVRGDRAEKAFEVLMRMVNRDGQWVSPSVFVPLAERANLMPKIDLWVVARTVRIATRVPDDVAVSFAINLSNQTLQDAEALGHIENTFASHRVRPDRFIFEISETGEIFQLHAARRFITQLKRLGCRFALDDFGAGNNSLSHLKWLPVDLVKVSGEFVAEKQGSEVDRAMAISLTQMAHSLKLKVIAERVDSAKALTWLRAAKVDYVQGHLFGEPRRLDEIDFEALQEA
jgi:diguanylate cyclase (GGDEF)-like protein/PAS domain S-box-containing protein